MEKIGKDEMVMLKLLYLWNKERIRKANNSEKCLGDKVREIIKHGITDNATYARRLLEMDEGNYD